MSGYKRSNITFSHVSAEWLSLAKPQLKASSIARYTNILELHLLPEYGGRPISSITRKELIRYSNELLAPEKAGKKALSPKTVNGILSVMKSIFEYAGREKNLAVSDIRDVSVKQPHRPLRILTRREQRALSRYLCENLSPRNLGILICLYTGLRIGEICALKWGDIYLKEQYLYVHKSMQRIQLFGDGERRTAVLIDSPKSSCSIRKIPIPGELMTYIKAARQDPGAFVLTGSAGSFIEPRTMENHFKSVVRECGISDVHFHSLRHTFATRCIELGFDLKSLSEILGHSNVSITLNRYVHPSMELKQKNMNMLSELIGVKKTGRLKKESPVCSLLTV